MDREALVQFSRSIMSDTLRLIDYSTPGLPVHHQLLSVLKLMSIELDVIQPSHPLSSPSSPAFSLSQHQGLFQ